MKENLSDNEIDETKHTDIIILCMSVTYSLNNHPTFSLIILIISLSIIIYLILKYFIMYIYKKYYKK